MSARKSKNKNDTNWIHTFQVIQPTRHKKDFTVYKVISKIFPRGFPDGVTTITVWKRYSDFKKLYKEIQAIYRQLHLSTSIAPFPKFPKGHLFGRFESDIIEERRQAALDLLQFAALHPQLYTSKIYNKFFESSYCESDLIDLVESSTLAPATSEDYLTKPCLVPRKLWTPANRGDQDDDDDDASISSVESSTRIVPTDIDSSLSHPNIVNSSSNPDAHEDYVDHTKLNGQSVLEPGHPESSSSFSRGSDSAELPRIQVSRAKSLEEDSSFLLPDASARSESGISSSASCSSIDTQVPNLSTELDAEDLRTGNEKETSDSAKHSRSSSFGFLDFLPIFPKKAKENQISEEKLLSDSLTSSYLCEAAGYFAVAQQYESCGEFPRAFSSYKGGIKVLLDGVKDDDNPKRKRLVRNKLEKYIARAESLHNRVNSIGNNKGNESDLYSSALPVSSPTKDQIFHYDLSTNGPEKVKSSPLEQLKEYKLVRVVYKRIYVVVNVKETVGAKCCVIKVLPKLSNHVEVRSFSMLPLNIPFLVKLLKWFETEDSYILLMEHASGGRLRDFVDAYQTKNIVMPKFDMESSQFTDESTKEQVEEGKFKFDSLALMATLNEITKTRVTSNEEIRKSLKSTSTNSAPASDPSEQPSENSPIKPINCFNPPIGTNIEKEGTLEVNPDNVDTDNLIANSKLLLKTVTQTLAHLEEKQNSDQEMSPESNVDSTRPQDLPGTSKLSQQDHTEILSEVTHFTSDDKANKSPKKHFGSKKSSPEKKRLTLFVDLQEQLRVGDGRLGDSRGNDINLGSPKKLKESTSSIDLSQVGVVAAADFEEPETINIRRMVPECCIRVWAAEIIMALEKLHVLGITYGDLDMKSVLLGENGHILLSYKAEWIQMDQNYVPEKNEYSAPEVYNSFGLPMCKIHFSSDFWSLGAILFELFTGQNVRSSHPEGFHAQTILRIPEYNLVGEAISSNVKSFLTELLLFDPTFRLGYYGAAELKSHPLFEGFDWDSALEAVRKD